MRHRVARVAGSLAIESEPGRGTAISARVPAIAIDPSPAATRSGPAGSTCTPPTMHERCPTENVPMTCRPIDAPTHSMGPVTPSRLQTSVAAAASSRAAATSPRCECTSDR